jgi:peptide/nickel transport system substrate-binding protein
VRQALCYALDKAEITTGLMQGLAQPLWTWISEAHWAHNPTVPRFDHDPARARQLLTEAGWAEASGGVRQKDGQRLALKIANIAGDVERLQVVQVAQQRWKAVGIETEIQPIQAAAFGQVMEGPYQIAYNWAGSDFEATNTFWLRQPRNWPRYRNDEAFALMQRANTTLDREERRRLHLRWQELLVPDQPEVWLFTRNYYDAVHQAVHNYTPVPWGRMTWNSDEWWLG